MLTLNGNKIPSFVKVNKVTFSILPPIENNLLKVRGKAGSYNMGQTVGQRVITADITIVAEKVNGVMAASRELAEWLFHAEPVKLVLDDEPEKYYLVLPDGETDVDETVNVGKSSLTFVCTEPYAFGEEHVRTFKAAELADNFMEVEVEGTAETFPKIELTMKEDVTAISLVSESDGKFITIGEEAEVTSKPVNTTPVRLWDEMSNVSKWTTAISVDGGTIQGSFRSNGYSFSQALGSENTPDYGTGTAWHGASAIRSLPSVISGDFEVEFEFGFNASTKQQIGRIELYLLDSNNEQFGKIAMIDASGINNHQRLEVRAGKLAGGKYFINDWGAYKGVWSNLQVGKMRIGRTGRTWFGYVGIWNSKKKVYASQLYREWTDTSGIATNPLAKLQIHLGAYKEYPAYQTMYFSDIKVRERLTFNASETPIIAQQGDVLLIDSASATVYKNGEVFYEGLNPSSQFFSLKKGMNRIAVVPAKADVALLHAERWL